MYQMQILVDGEWYGWGTDPAGFDLGTKAEAEAAARRARRHYWTARVVKVS